MKYRHRLREPVRRFVVIGHKATTSPDFSLKDIPGTSGRLDVLLRCVRSALLVSHGLRQDTELYLLLLGGLDAPKAIRFRGQGLRFLNPDERSTAALVQKALATPTTGPVWQPATPGVEVAAVGVAEVLDPLAQRGVYVLEEDGADVRSLPFEERDNTFIVGDHLGFTRDEQALFLKLEAKPMSVGPVSLHADDAITLVHNELDRRKL